MTDANKSPWSKIILLVLSLVTAVSPIDLLPDVLPVLGQVDDVIAIGILIALLVSYLRKRKRAESSPDGRGGHQASHRGYENAKYAGEDEGGESFYKP